MSPQYSSLVGGYFSSTPFDMTLRRSVRTNNPWALNWSSWQTEFPGYVGMTAPDASPNANKTVIYETPEHGIAAGYVLLKKYRDGGYITLAQIINHYGGGQNYSEYKKAVMRDTGFAENQVIILESDAILLKFAKAMFAHEAARKVDALPWSDKQILYGFSLARSYLAGKVPAGGVSPPTTAAPPAGGFWAGIAAFIASWFGGPAKLKYTRDMKRGDEGPDVKAFQKRLHELGFGDLLTDKDFGEVTEKAVREFQERENLDVDGEVGSMTINALNAAKPNTVKPPLLPPSTVKYGDSPEWYKIAEKWIGWKETGNNQGIEEFIRGGKCGKLGDPYCAIWMNYCVEMSGYPGTRSAMAQSFKNNPANFIKLPGPALGAIVPMWRDNPQSSLGHVFQYDGENAKGIRGIGANENNRVQRSFHARERCLGYFWPKTAPPPPKIGKILVNDDGSVASSEV